MELKRLSKLTTWKKSQKFSNMHKMRECIGDTFLGPLANHQAYPKIEIPGVYVICNTVWLISTANPLVFSTVNFESWFTIHHHRYNLPQIPYLLQDVAESVEEFKYLIVGSWDTHLEEEEKEEEMLLDLGQQSNAETSNNDMLHWICSCCVWNHCLGRLSYDWDLLLLDTDNLYLMDFFCHF